MEKVFAVQQVAKKLIETERSLDATITQAAELMADLLKTRRELNISAVVGDAALTKLIEATSALGQARSAMVGCHHELNDVRLRLGVRTRMAGLEDKPNEARQTETTNLRDVG